MVVCSSIRICAKVVLHLRKRFQKQMRGHTCYIASPSASSLVLKHNNIRARCSCISVPSPSSRVTDYGSRGFQRLQCRCGSSIEGRKSPSIAVKNSFTPKAVLPKTMFYFSYGFKNGNMKLLVPKVGLLPSFKFNVGSFPLSKGSFTAGLLSGLLLCYSTSDSMHAEALEDKGDKEGCAGSPSIHISEGKKVYTDYSVIGIPGDGRCLFRSVAHGACLRSGKPAPSERLQKELADDLRAMVADEFIKRRQETEWFIEGDFDKYISQMRKPHAWGGEPELLMLSHVLRMPITVYMHNSKLGGLISIAEYGQEYGEDNPIRVLYHGYGHYDAVLMPGKRGGKSRL